MLNLLQVVRYAGSHEVKADGNGRRADGPGALQDCYAEDYFGSAFRDCATRGRIQETVHAQSSKARPKTEAEIRFPRPCRQCLERRRRIPCLASQSLVSKPLADNLRY